MADHRSEEFLKPYRQAVSQHGASFEATLWGSREAQGIRFDVMIDFAGFEQSVVVDVGCGRGDMAVRLLERGVPFAEYIGIDALSEQIEEARARGLERCRFEVGDVLADPAALSVGHPDFLCFSGTLNTMDEDTARALVRAAFDAAAQGVVFNFLSDRPHPRWHDRDLAPAHRFSVVGWLDWAFDLTSRVSFTQEYLDGHDATIFLRHDG